MPPIEERALQNESAALILHDIYPYQLQRAIFIEAGLLTAPPRLLFQLNKKFPQAFDHIFWEKRYLNLFPQIKIYSKPPKSATDDVLKAFWQRLIAEIGTVIINALPAHAPFKKLYKAIFRDDLATIQHVLNDNTFKAVYLSEKPPELITREFWLPNMSPAQLAHRLNRRTLLDAWYQWVKHNNLPKTWWACALNQPEFTLNQTIHDTKEALFSMLSIACQNGHLDAVKSLLTTDSSIVSGCLGVGATPLWIASYNGYNDIVETLINAGAPVDMGNLDDNSSPLWIACQNGSLTVVKTLLGAGAFVDTLHIDGSTPLYITCQNGHVELAALLIENGAMVNHVCFYSGSTPLYAACQNGHNNLVALLLQHGANINHVCTINKGTLLYIASQNGHLDVVKTLMKHGVDINLTYLNWKPIRIARYHGHKEIEQLLLQREKITALDEANVLKLFKEYGNQHSSSFFHHNRKAALVKQALGSNPTLEDLLKNLKTISQIDLRAHRSGKLNALIHLAELVIGKSYEDLSLPAHLSPVTYLQHNPASGF